ncbi:MAG: biopolymer transporter ExbD [Gemmatimonadetes bacterium]|nr:biopolymer transporter ExbD [Gemmatimonadota bacterium]
MPRRRSRGHQLDASAEINVTSLVDVALTLLVIFIITAPMLTGGVEVSVPQAQVAPMQSPEGVIVSVDRDGNVFIGESPVRWEDFGRAFPDAVGRAGAKNVYLRADEGVPYGRVVQVLGAMKAADVATVGLVAEPEETRSR